MFEKEAEEYAGNREVCDLLDAISEDLQNYDYGTVAHYNIDPLVEECFKDGAEFGYNKANEWHYVKDGDLPNKELEEKQLLVRVRNYTEDFILAYYMLDEYYSKNGKRFYFDIDCDSPINTKNIIAWKEIVLPKEEMENESHT